MAATAGSDVVRAVWLGPCIAALALWGCGTNTSPHIQDIDPRTGYVGSRIELEVLAADPDGDSLEFSFSSPTVSGARLLDLDRNEAIFSWTPLAPDVGQHQVDFQVSDGELTDMAPAMIIVKPSTDPDTAPVFRKPLGEGTTLDLATNKCITLEVLVEDADSVQVEIRQEPPIPGATLQSTGTHNAILTWCPSSVQAAQSLFTLRLVADDRDNAPVRKNYTILVRSDLPQNCPGSAPVIQHTAPASQKTLDPIPLKATITDDKGLKGSPTVYFSTTKPVDPNKLDYSSLGQVSMTAASAGTALYTASLPNPTGKLLAGETATVYYVIVAEDNDDSGGSCDHRTQAPKGSLYQVLVTKPEQATLCTSGAQCKAGQVCDGTSCVTDTCTSVDTNGDKFHWDQNGCPTKHVCPVKGPGISPSHCVSSCTTSSDCKVPGSVCKVFDTKKGCGQPGSKGVGKGCADFTECSGKAMCLPWTGGYCAISDCDSYGTLSGQCPSGSACIPLPDDRFQILKKHWVCLQQCKDNTNCRTADGYTCKTVTNDQGSSSTVCLK